MPWHQSLSNPRKVYNERHEQVCICETPEQAALIVDAVRVRACSVVADSSTKDLKSSTRTMRANDAADSAFLIV